MTFSGQDDGVPSYQPDESSSSPSATSQSELPETPADATSHGPSKIKARKPQPDIEMSPDLSGKVRRKGTHPGDRYVKVVRRHTDDLRPVRPGLLIAAEQDIANATGLRRSFLRAKRLLIGAPLTTAAAAHERLTKVKALAVLSSDALSSVAYATEEILRILLLAGLAALSLSLPIAAAIVVLLFIVGASYRQTIKAYPHGGGSYIVAKDNLGETPALIAGGALLVAYILTVAVSISAAVAALVSAVPSMQGNVVIAGLLFILLVTLLNLRGIRESGSIFAVPTYLFLIGIAGMIIFGIVRNAADGFEVHEPQHAAVEGVSSVGLVLLLRAFAQGCAALTGVEAISDGVPAFQKPEWKNARATLTWMIAILAVTFSGITFLAHQYGAVPLSQEETGYETVVSQIARGVFGGTNVAYYAIQAATVAILVLAANTAFSDFPRLAYFMARDKYMPSQFTFRGDRLAYSFGILTLGVLSAIVLAVFGGHTDRLIPLYAFGVFTAFTMSQAGMVMRWYRRKEAGWKQNFILNALGAAATAIVALVVITTRFFDGAWVVILILPLLVMTFRAIHTHYLQASTELEPVSTMVSGQVRLIAVMPIAALNRVTMQTLTYAKSITDHIAVVHISDDEEAMEALQAQWNEAKTDVPLVIIESPYRSLVGPLISYIVELQQQNPDATINVILPEYVPSHWWEQILHNQTALRIKAALLFRPGIVVTSVPYHMRGTGVPQRRMSSVFMRRI
jgi:amino acid transporter